MAQDLDAASLSEILPETDWIEDLALRTGVVEIWRQIASEMLWDDIRDVPKNNKAEAGRALITHVRGVTLMALELCKVALKVQGKAFDHDLLIAACLLHDASKPVEYDPDPAVSTPDRPGRAVVSAIGRKLQHGVYASHKILQLGLPLELAHLVLTHTHASNRRGQTWEAAALFYADFADSDAALDGSAAPMFMQRWKLN